VSEPRMTLHAEMLGHGADGERASIFLAGLLMAQVALVLARLGSPTLSPPGHVPWPTWRPRPGPTRTRSAGR